MRSGCGAAMIPIEFTEQNGIIGKDQPEYLPLPAHRVRLDPYGRVVSCWYLTFRERIKLLWTGVVWQQSLTFDNALQPQLLSVEKPDMPDLSRAVIVPLRKVAKEDLN